MLFDIAQPAGQQFSPVGTAPLIDLVWYPFLFQLTNGKVILSGGNDFGALSSCPQPRLNRQFSASLATWADGDTYSYYGSTAAMYAPDRFIKVGEGEGDGSVTETVCTSRGRSAWRFDAALQGSIGGVVRLACMNHHRVNTQLVVLPDGQVIAIGGAATRADTSAPVLRPEMINPDDDSAAWTSLAQMASARAYHSSTVLLPDARVLTAGGQNQNSTHNEDGRQVTAQIFKPPYLFDSSGNPATRPVIAAPSLNTEIKYGNGFDIVLGGSYAEQIAQVVLMRSGAATHGFDHDQRRVPLEFVVTQNNTLKTAAPAHGNIAPPGYYMLFVLQLGDRPNIFYPSVATWVKLK